MMSEQSTLETPILSLKENELYFTQNWFDHNTPSLNVILDSIKPKRILEIGSFEGRSTCYFIEKCSQYHDQIELFCVDTWQGGQEHQSMDLSQTEQIFNHNAYITLKKHHQKTIHKIKSNSHLALIHLLSQGHQNTFDFIYVDGSHEAPDVLLDALLAHKLARAGGVIVFDDYLWSPSQTDSLMQSRHHNHYLLVKPAVDSYVNIYRQKIHIIQGFPLYQLYIKKLVD